MAFWNNILPRQPSDAEAQALLKEMEAEDQLRKADLFAKEAVKQSIERELRTQAALNSKDKLRSINIDTMDPLNTLAPEIMGTAHPGTQGLSVSFDTLRAMSRVPVIDAIIYTRLMQVARFTQRQRTPAMPGFRVRMREARKQPSAAALKRISQLEAWFETCGDPTAQEDATFETFTTKYIRDSLVLDQACAEILHDKYGKPAAMIPLDAATIRKALPTEAEFRSEQKQINQTTYVQVLNSEEKARWDSKHMMFGVRRPRTDLQSNFYGYPELEVVMRNVTYLLQAEFYNAANFTNGMHASGIIAIMSSMDAQSFYNLDMKMRQSLSGAMNAHRTMFIQLNPNEKEDIKPIQFNQTNKEMEFSEWIRWLIKVICGVYQMDPAEVNFFYGNEGQSSSLQGTDSEERVSQSKERGLPALLRKYASWLNRSITYRLDEDFELVFEGIDEKNPLTQSQLDTQELAGWGSINEIRAKRDLPSKGDHWLFNVPLNPNLVSTMNQENTRKEQAEQAAQEAAQKQAAGAGPEGQEPAAPPEEPGQDYTPNSDERSALPEGTDVEGLFKAMQGNTFLVEVP